MVRTLEGEVLTAGFSDLDEQAEAVETCPGCGTELRALCDVYPDSKGQTRCTNCDTVIQEEEEKEEEWDDDDEEEEWEEEEDEWGAYIEDFDDGDDD